MPLFGGNDKQQRGMEEVREELERVDRTKGAWLSDLTAQDFWLIRDQGYAPVGLVLGNSVFSIGVTGGIATAFRGLARGELTVLTELMYAARELAMARMKREADELGADGVVGVKFEVVHHGDVMEVTALGTAVKQTGKPSDGSRGQTVIPVQSS